MNKKNNVSKQNFDGKEWVVSCEYNEGMRCLWDWKKRNTMNSLILKWTSSLSQNISEQDQNDNVKDKHYFGYPPTPVHKKEGDLWRNYSGKKKAQCYDFSHLNSYLFNSQNIYTNILSANRLRATNFNELLPVALV